MCLLGRFIFGVSDAQPIFQQTILCMWVPCSELPVASGLMNFLVKIVRAANDKTASSFYNLNGNIEAFFWLGFTISVMSCLCIFILMSIHDSVYLNEKKQESENVQ